MLFALAVAADGEAQHKVRAAGQRVGQLDGIDLTSR
jgi:hypothetical protein